MALKGDRELRARLRSLRQVFKPIGKNWAETTRDYARGHVPVKTGQLQRSIRVRNASQRKAAVVGHFSANFVDAGTQEHTEVPKKRKAMRYGGSGGQTIFSRKVNHPRTKAQPFKVAAAHEGFRKNPMALQVIKQWNDAAP